MTHKSPSSTKCTCLFISLSYDYIATAYPAQALNLQLRVLSHINLHPDLHRPTVLMPSTAPTSRQDTRTGFLDLPRELRDMIYHHYIFEPDGYHYDYESGKLRTSKKCRIYLALERTCKVVAQEMHHLALGSNVLHFWTVDTERINAGRCPRSSVHPA